MLLSLGDMLSSRLGIDGWRRISGVSTDTEKVGLGTPMRAPSVDSGLRGEWYIALKIEFLAFNSQFPVLYVFFAVLRAQRK